MVRKKYQIEFVSVSFYLHIKFSTLKLRCCFVNLEVQVSIKGDASYATVSIRFTLANS